MPVYRQPWRNNTLFRPVAGINSAQPLLPSTPANGLDFPVGSVDNLAADPAGNLYFSVGNSVFKLDQNGIVNRIAGTSRAGYSGDGGPATNSQLSTYLNGLAADSSGYVFFVDGVRIRRVAPSGTIATVAGNATKGYSGDGGPAVNAQFNFPYAIAVDGKGNLYVSDTGNNTVRKISNQGIITTVAANGTRGFSGDGGPAASAQLAYPSSLAVDNSGNLYIADANNLRIS